jgi:hypothetical protein
VLEMTRGNPLPVVLLVALSGSGCFGGGSVSPQAVNPLPVSPSGRLSVVVTLRAGITPTKIGAGTTPSTTKHRYSLTCGPPGGTMPNPAAACKAVVDYIAHRGRSATCIGDLSLLPSSSAMITGTFDRRPFKLALSAYSWCGQPKPVMQDFWTLSTFPCSTLVLRTGGGKSYASWAKATGCQAARNA